MRVRGVISNRLLLNYRCAPEVSAALLPSGLRPRLVRGHSIMGVCLIELEFLRPRWLPRWAGVKTMNAGYRIAVEWAQDPIRYGVYLPRRDTRSRMIARLGGRAFPGVHHFSRFITVWDDDGVSVTIDSNDRRADLQVSGAVCDGLASDSVFDGVAGVSAFFRSADRGFSPGRRGTEGLRLRVDDWCVRGFEVHRLRAGFYEDPSRFPAGSVVFDSAIFMRDVEHEWEIVAPPIP